VRAVTHYDVPREDCAVAAGMLGSVVG
jgi:hypothetical protein